MWEQYRVRPWAVARWLILWVLAIAGPAFADQRYAIVIGSNPGWSSDRPLRYAENDAERMRDVLVGLGGFAPDRVELLRDPDAADVRAALRKLAKTAHDSTSEDTLVFLYYSGHADNQNLHLRGEPLSHRELADTLRAMPATVKLAVVDACKSGAVTRKGGGPVEEFVVDVNSPKLSGMVFLTSSGADELSQESRALSGSVFTHHLVSGLRGAADLDGDRQVTVTEAYHYAYTRTRADTAVGGVPQRPAVRYELSGQGELVLTHLDAKQTASVTLPRGAPQKYVVLDAHAFRIVAEASAERDRDVVLSLVPGAYTIKRVLDDKLEVGNLVVATGEKADVAKLAYASAPLSAGIVKGSPDNLSPAENREWRRSQAFHLLADGEAIPALKLFDQLIREDAGDTLAYRGRGRALVRLAEAYQAVNDHVMERKALGDALKADPSLTEDPTFRIWYQRGVDLDARDAETKARQAKFDLEVQENPRTLKRFGVGVDLISTRGAFAVSGTLVIHRMVFPSLSIDFAGPGLDAAVTIAPLSGRWSPFLAFGGHVSARRLGLGIGDEVGTISSDSSYSYQQEWGLHGRVEGGAQLVGTSGFTTELGLSLILFSANDKVVQQLWPVIRLGWLW